MTEKKKAIIKGCILIAILIVGIIVTIYAIPWLVSLKDEGPRLEFKNYINSLGFWGWLLLIGIQIIQMVFAFIPGEIIEVLSGMMFGWLGGLLSCMLGALLGTIIIYYLVRKLGLPFIRLFFSEEKTKKFKFLQNQSRLDMVIFILYFIPGTPKDVITYLVPLTPMKPIRFFIISTVARIPSIVTSTLAGATIMDGDFKLTVIIFAITGVISLAGIIINNRYTKRLDQENAQIEEVDNEKSNL